MSFENDFCETTGAAREKARRVIDSAREHTGDLLARGSERVRKRPATALLAAFGLGVAIGIVAASALRPGSKRNPADSPTDSRERLAELFGAVAENLRDPLRKTCATVGNRASSLLGETVAAAIEKVGKAKNLRWR